MESRASGVLDVATTEYLANKNSRDSTSIERPARAETNGCESRLVAAARDGDETAFAELCRAHQSMILRVAERITGEREDARDAVQDALLSAYLGLRRFNGQSKFQTWLIRITINSALMIRRKRQRHRNPGIITDINTTFGEDGWQPVDERLDPEKTLLKLEKERVVRNSIQALPGTLRIAAELSRFHDCSADEIAIRLGVSVSAAKARLFRANLVLKRSRSLRAFVCS